MSDRQTPHLSYLELMQTAPLTVQRNFLRTLGERVPNKTAREEIFKMVTQNVADAEKMAAMMKKRTEAERNFLSVIQIINAPAHISVLCAAFVASGFRQSLPTPGIAPVEVAENLLKSALILCNHHGSHFNSNVGEMNHYDYEGVDNWLVTDERIVRSASPSQPIPLPLRMAEPPKGVHATAVPARLLTLTLVSLLQLLEVENLRKNQNGSWRLADLRRVAKRLGWKNEDWQQGDVTFEGALAFLLQELDTLGMISLDSSKTTLRPTPQAADLINLPAERLAATLLWTVPKLHDRWTEVPKHPYLYGSHSNVAGLRVALLFALRSLIEGDPRARTHFFSEEDLQDALFQRISARFDLSYSYYSLSRQIKPEFENKPPEAQKLDADWTRRRKEWNEKERPLLAAMLDGWMTFLGLVEVTQGSPRLYRLTELGIAALFPEKLHEAKVVVIEDGPAWVIQPNFDLLAYLDRLKNTQLAFLERIAERANVQEHVALYHLTRESVYRGLESGLGVEDMLTTLQLGAERDLPQNISAEIRSWATQREHITLWKQASLAEFPTDAAREGAMRAGLQGMPLGERYLLLTTPLSRPLLHLFGQTVNYSLAPHRNLNISEAGEISLHQPVPDFMLDARLLAWTELDPASGRRRFTRAAVQSAVKAGRSLSALFKLLEERQYQGMPPMLRITLRAWAGEEMAVGLGNLLVLRVIGGELNYAIQQSSALQPYLIATVTPGIYLVRAEQADDLRRALQELGLQVGSKVF